jgi:hypothetical protein
MVMFVWELDSQLPVQLVPSYILYISPLKFESHPWRGVLDATLCVRHLCGFLQVL